MMPEVKIERDGKTYQLTLNEIQQAYNAMLYAILYDEVEMRIESEPNLEVYRPYIDEIVERLRDELSGDVTDDVVSDTIGDIIQQIGFENDLEVSE